MAQDTAYFENRYNPRLAVPDYAQAFERWARRSEQARQEMDSYQDVPYGPHAMEKLDIFRAEGLSKGLLMFIHGGYWRALDKKDHSFVARELVKRGITVALINYALCPTVRVEDIVLQTLQATAWLYRNGSNFGAPLGKLYVAGHSAGGHLTAITLAAQWPKFAADLPKKVVQGALSISGVFDVSAIIDVPSVNVDVRLDAAQVSYLSPAFMPPATDAPLYIAVGGDEQEGFQEQHQLIAKKWRKVIAGSVPCPGDNHFTVLDRFADPESALFKTVLKLVEGSSETG